jgi:hypothetical protein
MRLAVDPWLLLNQAVLFAHVIAFAITVSAVLREDLRWLLHRHIDTVRLQRTVRVVSCGLLVLWGTGLALWAFAAAASPVPWGLTPKLCAKLVVVSLLTVNGWALHAWVFPGLKNSSPGGHGDPLSQRLPKVLGGISSASWMVAAFVGTARPIADVLSFAGFMGLYAASVGLALAVVFLSSAGAQAFAPMEPVADPLSAARAGRLQRRRAVRCAWALRHQKRTALDRHADVG